MYHVSARLSDGSKISVLYQVDPCTRCTLIVTRLRHFCSGDRNLKLLRFVVSVLVAYWSKGFSKGAKGKSAMAWGLAKLVMDRKWSEDYSNCQP